MNVLIVVLSIAAVAGVFLAGLGIVAALDRIPWVHSRIEAWLPSRGWWLDG